MSIDSDWLEAQGEDAPLLLRALAAQDRTGQPPATLGLAVSGGSDSLALLHLSVRAAAHAGWPLRAVTVDHRLRPEAAEEAALVGRICEGLGVPHDVLVWDHGDVAGNLMQAASEARYALMADWAQARGIDAVVLAHTADDQAETFLMGLSRAAGLDGLCGMRPEFKVKGVIFRRPFLTLTRASLRACLDRHGLAWIEDPSNENDRFTRVKARRALKGLKPLGITSERLSAVVRSLSMAQGVVHEAVARAARESIAETAGALQFQADDFQGHHPEIRRRLLIAMIRWITLAKHPPRETKVDALQRALEARRDATLAGVRFRWQGEICMVSRELRACGAPVPVGAVWDGRWILSGPPSEIRALGPAGLRQCPDWRRRGLPRTVLEVTPGLWQGAALIAAPCAGLGTATATCTPSFHQFLLSH